MKNFTCLKRFQRLPVMVFSISSALLYIMYHAYRPENFQEDSNFLTKEEESFESLHIDLNISGKLYSCNMEKKLREFLLHTCPNWKVSPLNATHENLGLNINKLHNESTCSDLASSRGPNQCVVSFSFYGNLDDRRGYFKGIEENAALLQKYYPNWVMRVYHDIPPLQPDNMVECQNSSLNPQRNGIIAPDKNARKQIFAMNKTVQQMICQMQCTYSNLDFCYAGNIPGFGNLLGSQGNMWRFLAMADPLVDVFISRDLDSRPSQRELAAVNEWLKTNMTFHVMRDHPYHSTSILAGMWGAVVHNNRKELGNLTIEMMKKGIKAKSKGLDQNVLDKVLWPVTKGSLVQHDSYFCSRYGKDRMTLAWPTRRNTKTSYNFVGARIGVDIKPLKVTCPEKCRPPGSKHWVHC